MAATSAVEPSWLDPHIAFLSYRSLSTDVKEVENVQRTSAHFSEDKKLYQHSFGSPYLLCIHSSKTVELLAKLHEGIGEGHSRGRSLAHQAMAQEFWWPNMQ